MMVAAVTEPKNKSYTGWPVFIYYISRGLLVRAKDGLTIGTGLWSGHGPAKNDPKCCGQKGVGPLPPGLYHYGDAVEGGHLGPYVMPLTQLSGQTFSRSGFYIHGAALQNPDMSSAGCIIAPKNVRIAINTNPATSRLLEVRT